MLSASEIDELLAETLPNDVWVMYRDRKVGEALAKFIDLLVRWNRVVSLTSVKSPEEIVRRHVAESLCCAAALRDCESVLDIGSGAGFPGIPLQLMRPDLPVTLAESNARKAAFLQEVGRELKLKTRVFAGRAQELQERSFTCVCLRAVDPMKQALEAASMLASERVYVMGSPAMEEDYGIGLRGWELAGVERCGPGQGRSVVYRYDRSV